MGRRGTGLGFLSFGSEETLRRGEEDGEKMPWGNKNLKIMAMRDG